MFLEEAQINATLDLLNGKTERSHLLSELIVWAHKQLNLTVLNFFLDILSDNQPRIKILVWDENDENKFFDSNRNYNKDMQKLMREKFAQLSLKYNVYSKYQNPDMILVCIDTLKDELIKRALNAAENEITNQADGIIWNISVTLNSIHIFFETDSQIKESSENGYCDELRNRFTDILNKYDEYNLFQNGAPCVFTSQQTLNEKYDGNMYYYLL